MFPKPEKSARLCRAQSLQKYLKIFSYSPILQSCCLRYLVCQYRNTSELWQLGYVG